MASSAARGVTSIQRGVVLEGTTTTSSRGQTSATAPRGSAPRQVTRPAIPSRSARPSSSSWAGPVPTTVSVQRPTSFTAARNRRSSPFSGTRRPTNPMESPVCGARWTESGSATPSWGIVRCGSEGWPRNASRPASSLTEIRPAAPASARFLRSRASVPRDTGRLSRVTST